MSEGVRLEHHKLRSDVPLISQVGIVAAVLWAFWVLALIPLAFSGRYLRVYSQSAKTFTV